MECPTCGYDKHRVIEKPVRAADADERLCRCLHCETLFHTTTRPSSVLVIDPDTMRRERIPIEKFQDGHREFLLGRAPHPSRPYRT